jgi:hypothetical protein
VAEGGEERERNGRNGRGGAVRNKKASGEERRKWK